MFRPGYNRIRRSESFGELEKNSSSSHPKVAEHYLRVLRLGVEEDVLRLEVLVNDVVAV